MIAVPTTTLLSSALAVACALLFIRSILSIKSLLYFLGRCWRFVDEKTQSFQIYKIPRNDDVTNQPNPLHRKALAYVTSLPSVEDSDRAHILSTGRKPNDFYLQPDPNGSVPDAFLGARLRWTYHPDCLHLRVRRQDRHRVLRPYLQHVESVADEIENRRKEVKLFTNSDSGCWWPIPFTHPSSFDTVVMDSELKNRVKSDLESFVKGRSYYARLGRVWKRSYMLHGPPGTGKTTFVAAMARFLNYDIYDLDLSKVSGGLKSLLLQTSPKSIILVENLDRYLNTPILNIMDGVFSCCGEERVMVFTMSSGGVGQEAVDPVMLRPGRLDVHIYFPLCDFTAFKSMANSYLGVKDHKLYPQVEEGFLQSGAKLSPAEIGEIMIANRGSPNRAIKSVINALHQARRSVSGESEASVNGRRVEEIEGCGVSGGIGFRKEATVREFKKLYGLIRRSGSKREGTMTVEMAAAAAVAANTAVVTGRHSNELEKDGLSQNSC